MAFHAVTSVLYRLENHVLSILRAGGVVLKTSFPLRDVEETNHLLNLNLVCKLQTIAPQ